MTSSAKGALSPVPLLRTACRAVPLLLLTLVSFPACASEHDGPLMLKNDSLVVEIDRASGNFLRVVNRVTGQHLLRLPPGYSEKPPWEISFLKPQAADHERRFRVISAEPNRLRLLWESGQTIRVQVTLDLPPGSAPLEIRANVDNTGKASIKSFRYPIFYGIQPVGADPEKTFFTAPFMVGRLCRDPMGLLGTKRNIFAYRYPGGNKAAMQFFSLYEQDRGGFYLATHDPHHTVKEFALRETDGTPISSVNQRNWDTRPGRGLALDYPFVLAALTEGTWQEAADIYKRWATRQLWAQNPLSKRRKEIGWFLDQVGFTVFGISSKVDQRPWYQAFHDIVEGTGAKVLFVPSWDWNGDYSLGRSLTPRDFRADFNRNLEVVRKNGDYAAPFYFDLKLRVSPRWWDEKVNDVPGSAWKAHAVQPQPRATRPSQKLW